MGKIVKLVASTLGSYAGWRLGAHLGLMTAFFFSLIGTALGVYWAQRWVSEYLS
jgi:hypothetical protein